MAGKRHFKTPRSASHASQAVASTAATNESPQPSESLPKLGFAPPRASLSKSVRVVIDDVITTASSDENKHHRVDHMRKGLEQIEHFMHTAHADADGVEFTDFETMVASQSNEWRDHIAFAKAQKKEMNVQLRRLQTTLQLDMTAYDLKVGRPGRPDDCVYQTSEYARKFMPRGNFVAEWTSPSTPDRVLYFPLVRAYRKFTGQEDDGEKDGKVGNEVLSNYFTKPMAQTKHVISTTKENGEAAHLAVLKRSDGKFLYVVGSKNTHMVVTSLEDIDRAIAAGARDGGSPYMAAAPVARALIKTINRLAPEKREFLCELLAQTRMTASFEMLSPEYQHVQLLDHVDEDTPVFYGLSFPILNEMEGVEICVNPVLAYELVQWLGIRTVQYSIVPFTPDVMAQMLHAIRTAYQHEGAVNLFLDEEGCVIGMEKFKTVWYVCLRAIREKAKGFISRALPKPNAKGKDAARGGDEAAIEALKSTIKSLQKRFLAIQEYLGLTDSTRDAHLSLGESFVTYLHDVRLVEVSGEDKEGKRLFKERVATLFPVVWKEFLEHTQLSDRVE